MKTILQLSFCVLFAVASNVVIAQERTVSGRISSTDDGSPIPGVNVLVKGTINGTVSDADGNYKLAVPSNETTLVFSFVGYTAQEINIGSRSVIDISMDTDITELVEVVVTAVGIEREKRALGYATTNLASDKIVQKGEPDLVRSLSGKIAGVNVQGSSGAPGASTNITIRGSSSINGSNQPLFVVDGIPFDNSKTSTDNVLVSGAPYSNRAIDIDPNDIESISVLKGAAAAVLYGQRAANGVILITTRSGKGAASAGKGLEVTLRSSYTVDEVAGLPKYQNRFGQGGTTGGGSGVFSNAFFGSWGPSINDIDSINDWKGNRIPYQTFPNNVKDFFETGQTFDNSVSLAGGNSVANFITTISDSRSKGIIPNSEFNRTTLKVGGNAQLANGLFFGGSVSYINSSQLGPPTGGGGVVSSGFSTQLWFIPRSTDIFQYPYKDENNFDNWYRAGEDGPFFSSFENPFTSKVNRVFGNVSLGYEINDWLQVNYKIGTDYYTQNNKQVFAISSVSSGGIGSVTLDDIRFQSIESNLLITGERELSQDLRLRVTLGHNLNIRSQDRQSTQGTGLIVYGIDDLDNTQNVIPNGGTTFERRLVGVFADASLSFRDYLFLGLTGRNDWSSTLPQANNSFFYPAVTLGFIFSDAFSISNDIFSFGKLRLAYGKVGNDAPVYATQEVLYQSPSFGGLLGATVFPFNSVAGLNAQGGLGNSVLTPEFTSEVEVGTELRFFKNKLGLDLTYFDKTTTDQIFSVQRAPSSGFRSQITNAGNVQAKGIEIGLDATPIETQSGFKWSLYGTFTQIENEVISLSDGLERFPLGQRFGDLGAYAVPGRPFGVILGSEPYRDEEGNFLVDPTTGYYIANPSTTIEIADPNPDFITSLSNTFSFKGVSFGFLIDWKEGGDIYSGTLASLRGRGVLEESAVGNVRQQSFLLPGVLGDVSTGLPLLDSESNSIPNNIHIDANDYFWRTSNNATRLFGVYDATVIRLREVSLGYSFPESLLEKTFIGSASINFIGRNLWFNAPNMPEGYDPETNSLGSGNTQGIDLAYVPNTRRYGVTLQVTF